MSKKILLLEDDTLLLQTLQELLESEGYAVTSVACGNDAIDASYEDSFDLYVFDINVPDMNGLELLESLRNADDNTPAIFISALIDLQSISKAFEIGAEDYLKKPFFPEELLLRVNAKLSRKSVAIRYRDLEFDSITKTLRKEGKLSPLVKFRSNFLSFLLQIFPRCLIKRYLWSV